MRESFSQMLAKTLCEQLNRTRLISWELSSEVGLNNAIYIVFTRSSKHRAASSTFYGN